MRDYIIRFFIAGIMALCVGLLFFGVKHPQASALHSNDAKNEWIWPADGTISDTFGTRQGRHKGIDIAGKLNSPVIAADDGVVEKSYHSDSYGNVVFINHSNHYVTVYAHLNKRLVSEGQFVKKGEIIGNMGSSGQSTGVHLHFEIHQSKWTYDKKFALNPEGLLGMKKVGEVVQAGVVNSGETVLEASTRFPLKEESNIVHPIKKEIGRKYMVQKGDTLFSISRKNKVTVQEMKKINHLRSDLIKPKQILIVR